ncbi:MAG: hypothetical protein BYD32DRAFT_435140 [Podila humilis]|nr:MAG: hypothetical protein BYD32DRAFT_435140 [Podila humilis]
MDEHAPIVYDLTEYKEITRDWNDDPSAYLTRYYTKHYFLSTAGKELKDPLGPIIDLQTSLEVKRGDQYVYQSPNKLCIIGLAPTHPLLAQRERYQVLNLRFDDKIVNALPQPTHIPANEKKCPPPPCHHETVILKIEVKDLWAEKEKKEKEDKSEQAAEDVDMPETQQTQQGGSEESGSETPAESVPSSMIAEQGSVASSSTTSIVSSVVSSPSVTQAQFKPKKSIDPTRIVFVVRGSIAGHVMELNERLIRRGTDVVTDPEVIETMLDKASTHGYIAVIRPKTDKKGVPLKDLVDELPVATA